MVLGSLSAPALASPVGQVIEVEIWNAGGAGGSIDAFGTPTTPAGAQGTFVFDGAWHPIPGTSLEVKGESFGEVIPAGSAECNPASTSDVIGDCEYIELSVRDVSSTSLGTSVPAPTEQSTIFFNGIGLAGEIRNADVGNGQSNFYSHFSDDGLAVSGPGLAPFETPDLLLRPSVPAVIATTDASETAPFGVGLSTVNLGGIPLADYVAVFGLPVGWDGVTVGVVIESLAPTPAVPTVGLPGLGLLLAATVLIGAAATRRHRLFPA